MRRLTKAQPIGGASLCSFCNSAAYSGGSRSGTVAINCATFISGPLSRPSADDSALASPARSRLAAEQPPPGIARRNAADIGADAGIARGAGGEAVSLRVAAALVSGLGLAFGFFVGHAVIIEEQDYGLRVGSVMGKRVAHDGPRNAECHTLTMKDGPPHAAKQDKAAALRRRGGYHGNTAFESAHISCRTAGVRNFDFLRRRAGACRGQASGAGDRPVGGRQARLLLCRRPLCRRPRQTDHGRARSMSRCWRRTSSAAPTRWCSSMARRRPRPTGWARPTGAKAGRNISSSKAMSST